MVYHYPQQIYSSGIKEVYKVTTHNKAIGMFWWFFSDLMRIDRNKTWHKQLIKNWYKYQQENQTKILIIATNRTYSVWQWWTLPGILPKQ